MASDQSCSSCLTASATLGPLAAFGDWARTSPTNTQTNKTAPASFFIDSLLFDLTTRMWVLRKLRRAYTYGAGSNSAKMILMRGSFEFRGLSGPGEKPRARRRVGWSYSYIR